MSLEKSGFPMIAAMIGVIRSATKAVTTAPNATPITMPTARSTTLPRSRNALNSFTIGASPGFGSEEDSPRGGQLQDAVALQPVRHREERIRSGNAKELAFLRGAAGGGPGRLSEHEVRRGLLLIQPGDRRDDVLVPVEDEQVVDGPHLRRVP